MAEYSKGYGKRPLWQWILIYAVVGVVVYGLIYYFVLAKKGGNNLNSGSSTPNMQTTPSSAPTAPNIPGY